MLGKYLKSAIVPHIPKLITLNLSDFIFPVSTAPAERVKTPLYYPNVSNMSPSNINTLQSAPHAPTPPKHNQSSSKPLPPPAIYASKALGYTRIVLGLGSLLFPHTTCSLFRFPIAEETATVVRFFGVRGIALGMLLVTAYDDALLDGGKRGIGKLLGVNMACDVVDICTIVGAVGGSVMG